MLRTRSLTLPRFGRPRLVPVFDEMQSLSLRCRTFYADPSSSDTGSSWRQSQATATTQTRPPRTQSPSSVITPTRHPRTQSPASVTTPTRHPQTRSPVSVTTSTYPRRSPRRSLSRPVVQEGRQCAPLCARNGAPEESVTPLQQGLS